MDVFLGCFVNGKKLTRVYKKGFLNLKNIVVCKQHFYILLFE